MDFKHLILDLLTDKVYLKLKYRQLMGKTLNLSNPTTFNEKLQWLKLYDRNPEYAKMVDKYEVKEYVASIIGEEYIIPTLGVWDKFDDIDFELLPEQFVLKCTHDSGGIIVCRKKSEFDKERAQRVINNSLNTNYYYWMREWPYKNIKPRIIAEKYMEDSAGELKDYKFMCFNGKMKCLFVGSERFSGNGLKITFLDKSWDVLPFERHYPKSETPILKPLNFDKMIELAEILSKNIPFVRVDFYEVEGHIYFGEMTFYPGSGMEEFTPEKWDYELGSWITLPETRVK